MKITSKQYAKALYEMATGIDNAGVDLIVKKMLKILQKNSQIKLRMEIVEKFNEIANDKNNLVEAEVISGKELDVHMLEKIADFIKKKYLIETVLIKNTIRENIKGGLIIKVGDEIIDGSIARNLQNLKNILEK